MWARRLVLGLLMACIVARGIECAYSQVRVCQVSADLRSSSLLADPSDTDPNESGCLCKGALGGPCLTALFELPRYLVTAIFADQSPALPISWQPDFSLTATLFDSTLPISAGTLRAQRSLWQV